MMRFAAALLCASLPAAALAADPVPRPLPPALAAARPVDLLPAAAQADFTFQDMRGAPGGFARTRDANGRPVFTARATKGSTDQYAISASWRLAGPIAKGDAVLVRVWARALEARQETGEAEGLIWLEPAGGPRDATQSFSVGPDWTLLSIPFQAGGDRAAGAEKLSIGFANLPQQIEFAGIEVLNFGRRAPLATLPVTSFSYAGREPDAAWRRAALARIEATRTAPMTIRVVDRAGRPVPGARVEAAMTRSAFLWGSAVSADRLLEQSPDADRYRRLVNELFDTVVIENALKWPGWRGGGGRAKALAAIDYLGKQDLRIKGHTLVWPAWKFSPGDIRAMPDRDARIGTLVADHIRDITAATRGKLIGWDVINEAIHETDYWKAMPRTAAAQWFKLARASDPKLQLTFNEYGLLNRSSSPMMVAEVLNYTRELKAQGAAIDVLGAQAHVGQTPRAPVAVLADLDLLAADGQQVQITEYDFNTTDEALQADYTRDFLIALYSHPAATGFLQWGFWQKQHWKPDAAMFRPDWSEKPNAKVWRDYVLNRWKTRVAVAGDATGTARARGHLGTYRVTATANGRTRTVAWDLPPKGGELVVKLD